LIYGIIKARDFMKLNYKFIFGLIFILCFAAQLKAQQITGTLSGKDGSLPGATISIQNSAVFTSTDMQGSFILRNKQTGKLTLKITYTGYTEKIITIDVHEGENTTGNIEMSPAEGTLGQVIVKGTTASGQLKAISIKKNSLGIVEVLASDAIGKLPDRNAAEAVQRVQGVSIQRDLGEGRYASVRGTPNQWTSTLINGNRLPSTSAATPPTRGVQLDIFPSDMIEYVVVSKANTPDIEGDAIGGSINFITKTAPAKRTLNVSGGGNYNTLADKAGYNASILYGDRLFHDKLGFIVSGVIWNRWTSNNRYDMTYNYGLPSPIQSYSISQLDLRDYMANRITTGLNAGLEYKFNARNKIYAKAVYSQYIDHQYVHQYLFNFDAKNAQVMSRAAQYITDMYVVELGGEHGLGSKFNLNWQLQTDNSKFFLNSPSFLPSGQRGYPIMTFQQKMQYNNLSSDGHKYMAFDAPNGVGDAKDHILPYNATPMDPTQLKDYQNILSGSLNKENDKGGKVDLDYTAHSKLAFKFGGKMRFKTKDIEAPLTIYMPGLGGVPAPSLSQLGTESFPYKGKYLSEIGSPYNNVLINPASFGQVDQAFSSAFIAQYKPYKIVENQATSGYASNYYSGDEDVYAFYGMGTYDLRKDLKLVAGFRDEYTDIKYHGYTTTSTAAAGNQPATSTVSQVTTTNTYNIFMPMVHLKYVPIESLNLRLAYTKTLARPDFSQLNPGGTVDEVNKIITISNTGLKPTIAQNFDLMGEYFFDKIGILTGGVFYKHLNDLIYTNSSTVSIDGNPYSVTEPQNLQGAELYGFEAGISKRFLHLPGLWKGFGINLNYTFANSSAKVPRMVNNTMVYDKTYIPNQSKHLVNAALSYELGAFSARIAANYRGKSLFTLRQSAGPGHYEWLDENLTLDFSGSYRVTKRVRLYLELNNLTDAAVRYYHGIKARPEQAEWYKRRGQIGVNVNLF
jgi:TonB-dependent receptor